MLWQARVDSKMIIVGCIHQAVAALLRQQGTWRSCLTSNLQARTWDACLSRVPLCMYCVCGKGWLIQTAGGSVELRLLRCRGAAEDTVLMLDESLAPLVAQLAPRLRSVRAFVVLTDRGHMPRMPHVRAAQSVHRRGAWLLRCKDMPRKSALMLAGRQH